MADTTPTLFSEIFKIFLNSISNDYRLKRMFNTDTSIAEDMMGTWLLKASVNFYDCEKNVSEAYNAESASFTVSLTNQEKVILAELMILEWLEWNINNITQMNLSIQDSDFSTHAASQNLSAKEEYADKQRERVAHLISEYTKEYHPISQWAVGG